MYNPSFEDLDYVGRCAVKMATKAHGAPPQWAEDAYQQAVVEALECAHTFDQDKAGWNTWSYFRAKDGYLRSACISDLPVSMSYTLFKLKSRPVVYTVTIDNLEDSPADECENIGLCPRQVSEIKTLLTTHLSDDDRASRMVAAQFGIGCDPVKMADLCSMFWASSSTIRASIKNKLACLRAELERQGFKKIDFCS